MIVHDRETLATPVALFKAFSGVNTCLRDAERVLVVPKLASIADIYSAELRVRVRGV